MAGQRLGDFALRFLETALRRFETALRFLETALRGFETALRGLDPLQCGSLDLERCVQCFTSRRQGIRCFVICHDNTVLRRMSVDEIIFVNDVVLRAGGAG